MIRQINVQTGEEATRQPTAEEQASWDAGTARESVDAPKRAIEALEQQVTQRRIRDAIAGTDGGWLANQESLIAQERSKL